MRRVSLSTKIILGFSLALLLLLGLSVLTYRHVQALQETGREIAHSGEVLTTLENLLIHAQDAEVARGYLLTGDELFLAPYHAARETLSPTLQQLRQLTGNDPQSQEKLSTLESLVEQRLTLAQNTIDLRRTKGRKGAVNVTQPEQGRAAMAEIDSLVNGLRGEHVVLLQQRSVSVARSAQSVFWMVIVSTGLACVFVTLAGGALHRAVTRRKAAERALLQAYTGMERRAEAHTPTPSQGGSELPPEITDSKEQRGALTRA